MLDIVYTWLWVNSMKCPDGTSWIAEKKVNFSEMGEDLPLGSGPSRARFLKLIDNNIVFHDEELKRYRIEPWGENWLDFVDTRRLKYAWSITSEMGVNIYLYCLYRLTNVDTHGFAISVKDLKKTLGMNLNNQTTNPAVVATFSTLVEHGLIRGERYQVGRVTIFNVTGAWGQNFLDKTG